MGVDMSHGEDDVIRLGDAQDASGVLAGGAPRSVLFACRMQQWPISAMLKAAEFAKCLRARLIVLHVSPARGRTGLFRSDPAQEAMWALESWAKNSAAALARCNYILPGEIPSEQLLIRQGDFVQQIVRSVAETGAELVVIPPDQIERGSLAADIAHAAQVPVLIARPPRSHNIVLAATKLADVRYPVISWAGMVGSLTGAQMVLVHNVAPLQLPGGGENVGALPWLIGRRDEARPSAHLQSVARRFPRCVAAVVKQRLNTSQAILEVARACDADLIVLGVMRGSTRIERYVGGGIAARVTEHALRSVLLTPIPVPEAA